MINFLIRKSRWGFENCEDSKTSIVFESLTVLNSSDLWQIIRKASGIEEEYNPDELIDMHFWPHCKADGIFNTRFVEPDVLMHFTNLSIIFEVKRDDSVSQDESQWRKEIGSFCKTYKLHKNKVILIAVNGNNHYFKEEIGNVPIYKTSWERLYDAVGLYNKSLPEFKKRWLADAFKVIGIIPYSALDEMTCQDTIDDNAIQLLNEIYRINGNRTEI